VKEAVFPFIKFPGIDILLGPEMRSTGEVMGIDPDLGVAYAKSQMSAQPALPLDGKVFISVKDSDKPAALEVASELHALGFELHASTGTAKYFAENGLTVPVMLKIREGRPNVVDFIKNGEVKFILNTPSGQAPREDEVAIRSAATAARVPVMTTLRGARASIQAIRAMIQHGYSVKSLQEYHA
jgi:carbamoyl-phosphate synthase large subunit